MTGGESTLTTPFTTHNYLVTTLHDVTDDPCDNIDDLYDSHCPHDSDQVTKRTTRWWQGWLTTLTDDVGNLVWRPMWLLLTTRDDRSDDQNTTPTTLTTTGDYLWWSMRWPVDDPGNFLMTSYDSIWRYLLPKSKVASPGVLDFVTDNQYMCRIEYMEEQTVHSHLSMYFDENKNWARP